MARKSAREAAMKLLYQGNISGDYDFDASNEMLTDLDLDEKDRVYIEDILRGYLQHSEEIDSIIKERSKGWRLDRISKVDLSILRLAIYEILYRDDIPDSVSVNEGVELAKKYGNDKSRSFINGILGSYIRSTVKENEE